MPYAWHFARAPGIIGAPDTSRRETEYVGRRGKRRGDVSGGGDVREGQPRPLGETLVNPITFGVAALGRQARRVGRLSHLGGPHDMLPTL